MKKCDVLTLVCALMTLMSSLLGIFYSFGGSTYEMATVTGATVTIYGDGIYQNDTLQKAATTKGTDLAIVVFSIILIVLVLKEWSINSHSDQAYGKISKQMQIMKIGFLGVFLYDSICLSMGNTFNNLFLLYIAIFSTSLYSIILNFTKCLSGLQYNPEYTEKRHTGSIVFLVIASCSVLVWLAFIIPAVITHNPYLSMTALEVYRSEPTLVLDIGFFFPTCLFTAYCIHKKKTVGYLLSSALYLFLTNLGLCLIGQTIMQLLFGIVLTPDKYIGLVGTFLVIGIIATVLNRKVLKAIV